MVEPQRRRGRPARGGERDRRQEILRAATAEFAELGYDGATVRSIAARAGVDAALVHHYFGSKADLFTAAVDMPMRPDVDVPRLIAGPRDEVGERVVRYVLGIWDDPSHRRRGTALLRTAIGGRGVSPVLTGFIARELVGGVARAVGGEGAPLRASLAATHLVGIMIGRYVVRLPELADADADDIVAWVAPTIQRYLVGDPPAGASDLAVLPAGPAEFTT